MPKFTIVSRNSQYIIALAVYFLLSLFVLSKVIFSPGTIGFYHDWPLGPYPEMTSLFAQEPLYSWDPQSGGKLIFHRFIIQGHSSPFLIFSGRRSTFKRNPYYFYDAQRFWRILPCQIFQIEFLCVIFRWHYVPFFTYNLYAHDSRVYLLSYRILLKPFHSDVLP